MGARQVGRNDTIQYPEQRLARSNWSLYVAFAQPRGDAADACTGALAPAGAFFHVARPMGAAIHWAR
eukprot:CAMPEP_0179329738 /NCGR_PEP_ID=MMETSP0797-20121207/63289_1 /TAXON_ID=47934 /ORGANISM="Dinophysis acuminata, Strain DAEP01" /LENGTH=66 /DNA_ID=CAMNT_0021042417 /DNA_START=8 /DNA_END=209 /DNA_ORIENTATION=-